MTDVEIVEKIREGDNQLMDQVYKNNYKMMIGFVVKNNGTIEDGKEVFQEGITRFWKKISEDTFILNCKISTYIYSICHNIWMSELNKRSNFVSIINVDKADETENAFEVLERNNDLHKCIHSLSKTHKDIILLFYFEKMSMEEIASKLKFSNKASAKTQKYKAVQALQQKLKSIYTHNDFFDL